MNDLISKTEAINALKNLPTWWADAGGYYGIAQPPMSALLDPNDAISAIENLPIVYPEFNQWIPCDCELPKNEDEVIVSIKDESGDTPYEYTTSGWYGNNRWIVGNEFNYDVVAWRPPLKPYKKCLP